MQLCYRYEPRTTSELPDGGRNWAFHQGSGRVTHRPAHPQSADLNLGIRVGFRAVLSRSGKHHIDRCRGDTVASSRPHAGRCGADSIPNARTRRFAAWTRPTWGTAEHVYLSRGRDRGPLSPRLSESKSASAGIWLPSPAERVEQWNARFSDRRRF